MKKSFNPYRPFSNQTGVASVFQAFDVLSASETPERKEESRSTGKKKPQKFALPRGLESKFDARKKREPQFFFLKVSHV